jgi:hypothetical protein
MLYRINKLAEPVQPVSLQYQGDPRINLILLWVDFQCQISSYFIF